MVKRLSKYAREKPLESGCWCYVLLTVVPGMLWGAEGNYAAEAVFRYLLPGGIAYTAAVYCYGARIDSLGWKGFWKSFLGCSPLALLCVLNLISRSEPVFVRPGQLFWIFCCAVGEEIMGRMLLFSSITAGAADRKWGRRTVIVAAAMIFGMMHAVNYRALGIAGTVFQCCYTAGVGALLVWSYQRSSCLWGGILWHTALNLTGLSFG